MSSSHPLLQCSVFTPWCILSRRCSGGSRRSSRRSRSSPWPRGRRGRGTPAWRGSPRARSCWAPPRPSRTSPQSCSCAARTRCRGCARHACPFRKAMKQEASEKCLHLSWLPARRRHILQHQLPPGALLSANSSVLNVVN